MDRRQVLRRHPDHGRGPPHRGLRQVPATPSSASLPDGAVPRGADHGAARGQPLGHRLPRHADRHREPRPRRVRRHAAAHRRAAAEEAAALRDGRRGPPRRLRRPHPRRVLPGPVVGRAQGAPGVPAREHPAQPDPRPQRRDLGAHGHDARRRVAVDQGGPGADRRSARPARSSAASSPSSCPTSASSGCSTPTTATSAGGGPRPGCCEFEFADDTASDYETYDAVAQDRAAGV